MSGPYRTPGREVTEADRADAERRDAGPLGAEPGRALQERRLPSMIEQMIEAYTEARRRHHRGWMLYRLSYAARREYEDAFISAGLAMHSQSAQAWSRPPRDAPAPDGCEYIGTFRGMAVYCDRQMVAGWTVELEPRP